MHPSLEESARAPSPLKLLLGCSLRHHRAAVGAAAILVQPLLSTREMKDMRAIQTQHRMPQPPARAEQGRSRRHERLLLLLLIIIIIISVSFACLLEGELADGAIGGSGKGLDRW